MIKGFEDLKEEDCKNVITFPKKLKWAEEVLAETKEHKSDVSPLLAEYLDKNPQFDFRKLRKK